MALLVLAHVDAHDRSLVVEQVVGERARELGLADARLDPRNRNEPIGRFGSDRPARERRIAFATASTASTWSTTRSCSACLEMHELLHLAFHEPATGNAGPLRHDLGDVLLGDLLVQEPPVALELGERGVLGLELRSSSTRVP